MYVYVDNLMGCTSGVDGNPWLYEWLGGCIDLDGFGSGCTGV